MLKAVMYLVIGIAALVLLFEGLRALLILIGLLVIAIVGLVLFFGGLVGVQRAMNDLARRDEE